MTALMNTVSNSNMPSFVYLFFKEHCSLNHVDINGNTLLHLAAKSNSIGVAKILKHVFNDISTNKDSTYTTQDNNVFFDLNRTNLQGQSPIFLTVQPRNNAMLKFLLKESKGSITMKEGKGDTIKEQIMRHTLKDTSLFDIYMKYEDKMVISQMFKQGKLK